jgi:hypothetical protein
VRPDELAWLAGLFEGEGSVIHRGYSRSKQRGVVIAMTDKDVIERAALITQVGSVTRMPDTRSGKPMWRWTLSRWCDLEPLLREMLPWLGIRRRAKVEALLADPPRQHPNKRLSDEQVAEIRERYGTVSTRELAAEFGISQPYTCRLARGERRAA